MDTQITATKVLQPIPTFTVSQPVLYFLPIDFISEKN